jgi:hypothetical protein
MEEALMREALIAELPSDPDQSWPPQFTAARVSS